MAGLDMIFSMTIVVLYSRLIKFIPHTGITIQEIEPKKLESGINVDLVAGY